MIDLTLGDLGTVRCTEPQTTRDVLDYRVRICLLDDEIRQVRESARWMSRHVISPQKWADPSALLEDVLAASSEETPVLVDFLRACHALCDAAGISESVETRMRTLLDHQNGLDPEWVQPSQCECAACRRGATLRVEGSVCIYEDAGADVLLALSEVADLDPGECDEPYYVTQIRGVYKRSRDRLSAWKRLQDEEHAQYKSVLPTSGKR